MGFEVGEVSASYVTRVLNPLEAKGCGTASTLRHLLAKRTAFPEP